MYHPMEKQIYYNMGMKWNVNNFHTFIVSYLPFAKKDMFTVGYLTRPSNHLNLFGEYKMGTQSSETILGFKIGFSGGNTLKGTLNTDFKA